MPMELHGYVGIQRVWAWAQVVPMDNLVDGQRVGRWVMGWIWTSSTRPKPDPLPSLLGGHSTPLAAPLEIASPRDAPP